MTPRLVAAAALAALLAVHFPSRAESFARVRLDAKPLPDPSCVTPEALTQAVEALLNRPVFVGRGEDLRLEYEIEPDPQAGGWVAELRLRDAANRSIGVRRVHSPESDCAALDERVALVVALMVDVRPPHVTVHLPPRRAPSLARPTLELGSVAAVPWLGGLRFGARGALRVWVGDVVPVGLSMTWWPPATRHAAGSTYHAEAWHSGLISCPELVGGAVGRLGLCLSAELGEVRVRGEGLSPNREVVALLALGSLTAFVGYRPLPSLELRLSGGAVAPITRPRIIVELENGGTEVLHEASVVHALGGVSILVEFPP
jgi:hypothetical protein